MTRRKAPKADVKKRVPRVRRSPAGTRLLSGGNPQVAKADGDAPVQDYIAAMPDWKRAVGRRLDGVISCALTGERLRKAVKWNSPFYGVGRSGEDVVWLLSFHCFAKYVKVAFFQGSSLRPPPPGQSKQKHVRYLDIHEVHQIDEVQLSDWVRQASALAGMDV